MRGTLQHDQLHQLITGIIPAYAGNTSVPPPYMASLRDHPRICGEHDYGESYRSLGRGSSPHMRGTHLLRFVGYHRAGIIPAYAGNTLFCSTIAAFTGDHPRICGEHHRRDGEMRHAGGIIPAYAGNTTNYEECRSRSRDHPRICGEHKILATSLGSKRGSSPHMRGTLACIALIRDSWGIIPAYAGNTPTRIPSVTVTRDHPRICGEHLPDTLTTSTPKGSSPHMRGTRCHGYGQLRHLGIIPAYAGNTTLWLSQCAALRDHPRICGEHPCRVLRVNPNRGSSPHMRGTPC